MIFVSDTRSGTADVSDLRNDPLLQWQHRWYFYLLVMFGYALPAIIPGLLWGDLTGGFYFAGTLRLTIAHHVSNFRLSESPVSYMLSWPILSEYVLHQLNCSLPRKHAIR